MTIQIGWRGTTVDVLGNLPTIGERPVRALINRGIEYLEVRAIDLNPFARNGISDHEASLITLLMTASALADSPPNSDEECVAINGVNARTSWAGRRADQRYDQQSNLKQAGLKFLATLDPVAEALNRSFQTDSFTSALEDAHLRLDGTCPLLSEEIEQAAFAEGHLAFGLAQANQHHENWNAVTSSKKQLAFMKKAAADSLVAEQTMAASNEGTFDAFVNAYIHQP
jgi:glutamate--cysteine ligase